MIPIAKPLFGHEEMSAIQKPLETGWVVQGPMVEQFERKFSTFTGIPHSIATTSCTTALHAAVAALGLQSGDEVLVPAFTWVATANVVEYMGAKPVFVDTDLDTYNSTADAMAPLINSRTVGILPVHLFGLAAEMDPIMKLASAHDLWVVEDAACGFGATYRGQHVGAIGNAGAFSFHPRKSITTGEGGMITTRDETLATRLRSLRDHGATVTDYDRHFGKTGYLLSAYPHVGFNYRMTDIQGALGSAQMSRAEWIVTERRRRARQYDEALAAVDWLRTPVTPREHGHGYQAYVCLFQPEGPTLDNIQRLHLRRNEIMRRLDARGIATRPGTHAAALQEYYGNRYGNLPEHFPGAHIAERLSIALPLYPQMTDQDQTRVVDELLRAYGETA